MVSLLTCIVCPVSATAPWVSRITEINANTAVNVEAERKLVQANEEMQGLLRSLKAKDQNLQESTVKIELMERRIEAAKKTADAVSELESELSKARKQERAYEEAMEQLQADLDELEQDNAKLKVAASSTEKQVNGPQVLESETVPIEGSLETSHLLEQIDALRGTVRYLRMENSFLKGRDLLKDLQSLPALPEPMSRASTPALDPSTLSDSDDSDSDSPHSPFTLHSLAIESKVLYEDVIKFSTSPRVVDLSVLQKKRTEAGAMGRKFWMPKSSTPAHQVLQRKLEAKRLSRRMRGLLDRATALPGV